jgi:hypothetical protein
MHIRKLIMNYDIDEVMIVIEQIKAEQQARPQEQQVVAAPEKKVFSMFDNTPRVRLPQNTSWRRIDG